MKTFEGDFTKFLRKIRNNENFSLSRWGDGELCIIENKPIDLLEKGNGEFKYSPDDIKYEHSRNLLIESIKYQSDEYYIGIACPCCVGQEKYEYMKKLSGQSEDYLTWANIFVNSNYKKTVNLLIPELSNHDVHLVINENSQLDKLPFSPIAVSFVGKDAWINNINLIESLKYYITNSNVKNTLFLFAAGPLANILTYELWKFNKENSYIDIGSILDPFLELKITRGYQRGADTLNKICIW